ncbi:MAG: VWA domain-containing protein, partial [Deltaproteobacteria bacterium]|nr:VWA domain-containing protein [Deltaproteobacteria bacterium]
MKIMKKTTPGARSFVALILLGMLAVSSSAVASDGDKNNVVIVLDASGSMGETMRGTGIRKIDAAKKALKEVIKLVPPDTQIGILVFSASNLSNDWVYPLGPRNDAKLMRAIDKPQPGGRTPLGQYTKLGADALLAQREKQYGYGSYRLLIVTDGEAGDPELVDKYVPESMARGIIIDAIGVDMRSDHTLATKVSSYRRANDPKALKTAVAEVFAEVADSGSNATSQEAFDQLASIPDEMAAGMLKALSASGNHPI